MAETPAPTTFAELGLKEPLARILAELGYEAPTPIQERTIPVLLGGRDLIGQAQTGTGKTAAFALPILEHLDLNLRQTQALILAPTRELAMQVAEAIHTYAKHLAGVTVLPVYGGAPIVMQMKHLARGAQIVVGTPGRLIDHLDRGTLKLDTVRMVVLDEADEMLKMGFLEDVERILSEIPKPRQIALFSATMPNEVTRVAERHLSSPVRVEIERKGVSALHIEQRFVNLSEGQKLDALTTMLELEESDAVLIFRRTKTGAAELSEKLEARGFAAVAMHGDMNQTMRENVIRRLRLGQIEIVVATDVAARGLDVEQISHVINYDIPYDVEAYVHRIGRTGRAGRSGIATLFVTPKERRMMREIERFTGAPIKPMRMPSPSDVATKRINVFKDSLRKTIGEGDLDLYVTLIQQVAEEGPYDVADVAAAAAKIATAERSLEILPQQIVAPKAPREFSDERPRPSARSQGPADDGPRVRLSMAVGKREGIRPADVVGSIANEAGVSGKDIGPIDIRDEITYVSVPEKFVKVIIAKVGRAKFRGRSVNLKIAGAGDESRAPRASGDDETPRERKPAVRRTETAPRPAYGRPESKPRAWNDEARPSSRGASARPAPRGAATRGAAGRPSSGPRTGPGGKPKPGGSKGRFSR